MNRKASEEFISPYNILIWIILIGTVVAGITITGNAKTDVRSAEAKILAIRLADCLIENGKINQQLFEENFNITEFCSLKAEIINRGDYYAKISLLDISNQESLVNSIEIGNKDLELQCEIKKQEEHFAECYRQKIYVQNPNEESKDFVLQILSASNNQGEIS